MIRVSLLLAAVLYVTLLIAGQDHGQLRPGLAEAVANNQPLREITLDLSGVPYEPPPQPRAVLASEPPPVAIQLTPAKATPAVVSQSASAAQQKPVFTLASLPNLGGDRVARPEVLPAIALPEEGAQENALGANLLYVSANGVNVRMGPSKDTNVVAKLARGEAVTLVSDGDPDWAEILIEGDGVQGYIAKSLLRSAP